MFDVGVIFSIYFVGVATIQIQKNRDPTRITSLARIIPLAPT
jgi:hypothetical protein